MPAQNSKSCLICLRFQDILRREVAFSFCALKRWPLSINPHLLCDTSARRLRIIAKKDARTPAFHSHSIIQLSILQGRTFMIERPFAPERAVTGQLWRRFYIVEVFPGSELFLYAQCLPTRCLINLCFTTRSARIRFAVAEETPHNSRTSAFLI